MHFQTPIFWSGFVGGNGQLAGHLILCVVKPLSNLRDKKERFLVIPTCPWLREQNKAIKALKMPHSQVIIWLYHNSWPPPSFAGILGRHAPFVYLPHCLLVLGSAMLMCWTYSGSAQQSLNLYSHNSSLLSQNIASYLQYLQPFISM